MTDAEAVCRLLAHHGTIRANLVWLDLARAALGQLERSDPESPVTTELWGEVFEGVLRTPWMLGGDAPECATFAARLACRLGAHRFDRIGVALRLIADRDGCVSETDVIEAWEAAGLVSG